MPVRYGKRLTSAEAGPDGQVTAIFDDGTRAVGDLLIGADGIHSPVRTLIDPAAPAPRSIGLVIACGYAPGAQDVAVLAECLRDIPSAHAAFAAFERRRREQVERVVQSGGSAENPVPRALPAADGSQAESAGRGTDGTIRSVRD